MRFIEEKNGLLKCIARQDLSITTMWMLCAFRPFGIFAQAKDRRPLRDICEAVGQRRIENNA